MMDQSDKNRIKELFTEWLEVQDTRKQLNKNNKDLVDEAGSILEVKAGAVGKLFKNLQKRVEEGVDELGKLSEIASELED